MLNCSPVHRQQFHPMKGIKNIDLETENGKEIATVKEMIEIEKVTNIEIKELVKRYVYTVFLVTIKYL